MKTKLKKEENPGNRQNNADDIQAVLNLTTISNPFVREIVQMAGCLPNIICYTENQLNHHCEAMNHIFKLNLNWKPAKLPDLIKMLEKEIKHQEALTRGGIIWTW